MTEYERAKQSQDVEDRLIKKQQKIILSESAIEKINHIYKEVLGKINYNKYNNLESIGNIIDEINDVIQTNHRYYDDIHRLKSSYERKLFNM